MFQRRFSSVLLTLACSSALAVSGAAQARLDRTARGPLAGAAFIPPGFPDVVAFGSNSISLQQGVLVISGDVIANDASPGPVLNSNAELTLGPDVVTLETSKLKADTLRLKAGSVALGDVFYNTLVNQGFIGGVHTTPLALPVFSDLPLFQSATPGAADVVVPQGETLNLPAGAYALLDVKKGAVVYFTGGDYDFSELRTSNEVALLFDAPSRVRVAGKFISGKDAWIAPSPGAPTLASEIVFYVGGVNGAAGGLSATPKAAEIGMTNIVQANFYVPYGTLVIRGNTSATGAFLARDLDVGHKSALVLESAFFNRPPVAADDFATTTTGGSVSVLLSGAASVLANDTDPDGDDLTAAIVSGPDHGSLTLNPDGTFSYTHDGSATGSDSFVYEACDPGYPVLCASATVSITVEAAPLHLTVVLAGSGSGVVTSSPAGIDCGETCSATFPGALDVTLVASAAPGSTFVGFSGDADCADSVVSGPPDVTCVATFDTFTPVTLSVTKTGAGGGHVGSAPAGIDCGATCSYGFPPSTRVQLLPTAAPGSIFAGFGGDPDCEDGEVRLDTAVACSVQFDVAPPPGPTVVLAVTKQGAGAGLVTSVPAGIDCGPTCSFAFPELSRVELVAEADPGSTFVGFSGDPDCADGEVILDVARSCVATFDVAPPGPASSNLAVLRQGSGRGFFTSSPAGIACDTFCDAVFPDGTLVTLTATADEGSVFVAWGGDCSGSSPTTTVVIGPDKICLGTFAAQ